MGATFEYEIINKSKATHAELQKEWENIVSQCMHEYGHGGYSGTLKECSGMLITGKHFPDFKSAYDWLDGNTEKWQEAKLVSYDDVEIKVTQQITFNGEAGAHYRKPHDLRCVIRDWSGKTVTYRYADQLTDQKKKMLKREFEKYDELAEGYGKDQRLFEALLNQCGKFYHPDKPFGTEEWKELKRLRALLAKTKPKIDKAHAALAERDRKYADAIIKTKTVNNGKKYVVGGWCSC